MPCVALPNIIIKRGILLFPLSHSVVREEKAAERLNVLLQFCATQGGLIRQYARTIPLRSWPDDTTYLLSERRSRHRSESCRSEFSRPQRRLTRAENSSVDSPLQPIVSKASSGDWLLRFTPAALGRFDGSAPGRERSSGLKAYCLLSCLYKKLPSPMRYQRRRS